MPYHDFWMTAPDSPPLIDDFAHQDESFGAAFSILLEAIEQRAFPATSIAITHQGRIVALKSFGRFTYDADSPSATVSTLFDLASVTKVVATTSMAMLLYERGLLDLEAPVSAILPEFLTGSAHDSRRREVTLRMLLAHCSGLPAY